MERLWAPWRMKFIREHGKMREEKKKKGEAISCIFCDLQTAPARPGYVLYRHPLAYVVLNIYPYNPGHLLILPNRHTPRLSELSAAEHSACGALLGHSVSMMEATLKPQGFNIGMNLGHVAGAGIPEHLHYHIVPRWSGDTNFMPILGETRVLPATLDEVFEQLEPAFRGLDLS